MKTDSTVAEAGRPSPAGEKKEHLGTEALLRELLPIIDGLEAALDSATSLRYQELRQDIKVALHRLYRLLREAGIEPAENEVGKLFDPLRHEIVAEACDRTKEENTVLKVKEPGYCRDGEVIRPAKVVVNVTAVPCVGDGSC